LKHFKIFISKSNFKFLNFQLLLFFCLIFLGCKNRSESVGKHDTLKTVSGIADATTILERKQVPILCYHQIREWRPADSKRAKDYIVSIDNFREQLKMLADSGYKTILPDQLYAYLVTGAPLPAKPIMLTFDDTKAEQYTIGVPEMARHQFKGVYFIMTVALDRPGYMTKEEVKALADSGHVIGSHTWDHQNMKKLQGDSWRIQIDRPTKQLEQITGKKIRYFAYPFGLWNEEAIHELKIRGFLAAFQLSEKRDRDEPLYTIRRSLASGYWDPKKLYKHIRNNF
jgi:peptidoglycan/xylan/chitin deacetylase (PgdA/CDA1 family)